MNREIDIIAEVAKKNGVTAEEVRREIESAIREAYKNKDTRSNWDKIFGNGVVPSPEEFLRTMAEKLK